MNATPLKSGRSVGAAITLFFVAPLVAEFLLGNLPITLLPALIVLAPMYGAGALFIRELVRRTGRGWPTIAILGFAYGLFEEAFTTQSLFNPNYLKLNMHLLDHGFIPALGIGAWWTLFVLTIHAIFSICTSIALVEALVPSRASTPWLGPIGFSVTGVLFAAGSVASTLITLKQDSFIASRAQFLAAAAILLVLLAAAFALPPAAVVPETASRYTLSPWLAGVFSLLAGSAILLTPTAWGWAAALAILLIDCIIASAVFAASRILHWIALHKLALAAGFSLAYGWHSFLQKPVLGASIVTIRAGNALFTAAAIAVIVLGARRLLHATQPSSAPATDAQIPAAQ